MLRRSRKKRIHSSSRLPFNLLSPPSPPPPLPSSPAIRDLVQILAAELHRRGVPRQAVPLRPEVRRADERVFTRSRPGGGGRVRPAPRLRTALEKGGRFGMLLLVGNQDLFFNPNRSTEDIQTPDNCWRSVNVQESYFLVMFRYYNRKVKHI